jgi:glycosyltransferase involved in cell wall biosynthesis
MRIHLSVPGSFHAALLANALLPYANTVELFSPAPRRFFKGLEQSVRTRIVPSPAPIVSHALRLHVPAAVQQVSTLCFDLGVSALLGSPDLYIGWATACLQSGRASKRRGGRFVLDRACPHCDFQQSLIERESDRVGAPFRPQPSWFRQRQLAEYELADAILVPSTYTARSFPAHLQSKLVRAPLSGRCPYPKDFNQRRHDTFTVGVVGGSPLRKGYLYLLKAWEKLGLPKARLLLRTGGLSDFPLLEEMLKRSRNVEVVNAVPDISEFYRECDVFVLPSVDDGFGMALLEAMANGCACITTTNTGASELLTDGRDALIVEPANEHQLAESILRLYESEELRQTLALAARERTRSVLLFPPYSQGIASLMTRIAWPAGAKQGRVDRNQDHITGAPESAA